MLGIANGTDVRWGRLNGVTSKRRTSGTSVLRRREGGRDHGFNVGEGTSARLGGRNGDWGHCGDLETKRQGRAGERERERERWWGKRKRQMGRYLCKPMAISQRLGRILSNTLDQKWSWAQREESKSRGHHLSVPKSLGFWVRDHCHGPNCNHSSPVRPPHPSPPSLQPAVGKSSTFD